MSNQSDDDDHRGDKPKKSSSNLEELMTAATDEALDKADRLIRNAAEFRSESERLRAESRQALERAEQLDKKAKEIEADLKTLRYETMLQRLKRNDAALVDVVEDENLVFPVGYGKALGQALRDNTVVTKVELNLSTIFSSESRARLRGASETNRHDLDALVSNEMEPSLLHFLETSTSMRHLELCYPTQIPNQATLLKVGNLLVNALVKSKSLEELYWNNGVPSSGICTSLRTSQSLRRLNISLDNIVIYSADDRRDLASELGSNQTLVEFALQVSRREQDMAIRILGELHNIRSLRRLCLTAWGDYNGNYYSALSRCLLSAKDTLQEFEMRFFRLDDSTMETVLSGLVHDSNNSGTNGCASTTIARLIFEGCIWDDEAVERFAVFLQTPITNCNGKTTYQSKLNSFSIEGKSAMGHGLSRHLAASLLEAKSFDGNGAAVMIPTIGSQLKKMHLDDVEPAFFQQLSDNAQLVQLQELRLRGISKRTSVAFAKCMPLLKSIRVLGLSGVASGATPGLVHGLKRNCSVQDCHASDDDFSTSEALLIGAFCQRNQHFDQLMQRESTDTNSASETTQHSQAGQVHRSHPLMLQVAQQVPITQEAMLIRGLLSMGEHDSPCPTASSTM